MKPVDRSDYPIALEILTQAFSENPSLRWIVKKDRKIDLRLKALCEYCLTTSMLKNGAFISKDQHGMALIYKNDARVPLLQTIRLYFKLANEAVGWFRIPMVLYRQTVAKRLRPKEKHLYFFMIAVKEGCGLEPMKELRNEVYKMSERMKLPIIAETSLPKNKIMFERYGFKTYNSCVLPGAHFTLWFLRREPERYALAYGEESGQGNTGNMQFAGT